MNKYEIMFIVKSDLDEETRKEFDKLVSVLEGLDDVDVVYHNAE